MSEGRTIYLYHFSALVQRQGLHDHVAASGLLPLYNRVSVDNYQALMDYIWTLLRDGVIAGAGASWATRENLEIKSLTFLHVTRENNQTNGIEQALAEEQYEQ